MKLSAAILFATANAQGGGGRVRDKDVGAVADAYDNYNAGFGGEDAYGGFYDAFADAFGDVGNYGDYGYDAADDATAAPAAVDAGRPVEVVEEEADQGKTVFTDGLNEAASDPNDAAFNQNCWVATGNSAATWFTAGTNNSWQECNGGEHQACEIKVTRNSANAIIQIVSKCANQQSCVDNMKQNFNPAKNAGTVLYGTYAQQSCRPQHLGGSTSALFGARVKSNDSVCYFCVEPCDDDAAMAGNAAALQAANCVGPGSAGETNSKPIDGSDLDLLAATDVGIDQPVQEPQADGSKVDTASNFFTMNWYSTVSVDLKKNNMRETRVVSRIQHQQLNKIDAASVSPFA